MKTAKQLSLCKKALPTIVMLLALVWLTVSTPFIYAAQQAQGKPGNYAGKKSTSEKSDNTPVNTTEEKAENGVNTLSEYLHSSSFSIKPILILIKHTKCHPSDLYLAYHPELLSPPPEA